MRRSPVCAGGCNRRASGHAWAGSTTAGAADAAGEASGGAAAAAPRPVVSFAESNKALAMLLLNVKAHHLSALNKCSSGRQSSDLLASSFRARSNARRLQLQRDLTAIRMEPAESVSKYVGRAGGRSEERTCFSCNKPGHVKAH